MMMPTYNHTREDSPLTPCPECRDAVHGESSLSLAAAAQRLRMAKLDSDHASRAVLAAMEALDCARRVESMAHDELGKALTGLREAAMADGGPAYAVPDFVAKRP